MRLLKNWGKKNPDSSIHIINLPYNVPRKDLSRALIRRAFTTLSK